MPAPASGTLESIVVNEGDTVEVGALLGQIAEGAGAAKAAPSAAPAKAAEAAPAAKAELVDVVTPSAGESVTEAEVGEWSVKVGDVVKADDTLVELETDKAAQEVPAPVAGTVVKIAQDTGATVEPGVLLCQIDPVRISCTCLRTFCCCACSCGFGCFCNASGSERGQNDGGEQPVSGSGRRIRQTRTGSQG